MSPLYREKIIINTTLGQLYFAIEWVYIRKHNYLEILGFLVGGFLKPVINNAIYK